MQERERQKMRDWMNKFFSHSCMTQVQSGCSSDKLDLISSGSCYICFHIAKHSPLWFLLAWEMTHISLFVCHTFNHVKILRSLTHISSPSAKHVFIHSKHKLSWGNYLWFSGHLLWCKSVSLKRLFVSYTLLKHSLSPATTQTKN